MKASIVAIWGWIMPDPLAIPPTVMDTRPVVSRSATSLGRVSVVRIAAAAAGPPPGDNCAAARAIPPRTRSIGSRAPITPVEATSTSASSRPSAPAGSAGIAFASSSPPAPPEAGLIHQDGRRLDPVGGDDARRRGLDVGHQQREVGPVVLLDPAG